MISIHCFCQTKDGILHTYGTPYSIQGTNQHERMPVTNKRITYHIFGSHPKQQMNNSHQHFKQQMTPYQGADTY